MHRLKAQTIHQLTGGENCFSEDTGLEVDALGGEPGVHSARYAGEPVSYPQIISANCSGPWQIPSNRRARFITVICLILDGQEYFFEGRCEGQILQIGYRELVDSAMIRYFMPDGSDKSFAEMNAEEKNTFSHRRKAGDLLIAFLKTARTLAQ